MNRPSCTALVDNQGSRQILSLERFINMMNIRNRVPDVKAESWFVASQRRKEPLLIFVDGSYYPDDNGDSDGVISWNEVSEVRERNEVSDCIARFVASKKNYEPIVLDFTKYMQAFEFLAQASPSI